MRDNILNAMKKGEVTIAVMADFSKAFDTVAYHSVLNKLHCEGFTKSSLRWITSYLTDRQQYVQIDDCTSTTLPVMFGVPQGSILGPVLFNLYVNDLSGVLPQSVDCHQYADDTTLLSHCKPACLHVGEANIQLALDAVETWSKNNNLVLNPTKTKVMVFATQQLCHYHQLEDYRPALSTNGKRLERLASTKLLGVHFQEHLSWTEHINKTISSSYATLAVLRKLKNLAPFSLKKHLAECLILAKLEYCSAVTDPLPMYLTKRLSRVQLGAAAFVTNRYTREEDIINLGWLPIPERRQFSMLNLAYNALYNTEWPSYLPLERHIPARTLRSSDEVQLQVPLTTGNFQHACATVFNKLPKDLRNCTSTSQFKIQCKGYLTKSAKTRLLIN